MSVLALWMIVRVLLWIISAYMFLLCVSVIVDWIGFFIPDFRPKGIVLVVLNVIHVLTDPPIRWVRRFIPALRLGNVGLDLSVLVVFFALIILQRLIVLGAHLLMTL